MSCDMGTNLKEKFGMSLKDVVPFYQRVILQIGHFGTAKPSFISSSFMVSSYRIVKIQ
jgi:hypothetical protein